MPCMCTHLLAPSPLTSRIRSARLADGRGSRCRIRFHIRPRLGARAAARASKYFGNRRSEKPPRGSPDRDDSSQSQAAVVEEHSPGERSTFLRFGLHDCRRGFATQNAAGVEFQLQKLMQHRDLETTRHYVNTADRLTEAGAGLYVPNVKPVDAKRQSRGGSL